jgi:hypothetical protein
LVEIGFGVAPGYHGHALTRRGHLSRHLARKALRGFVTNSIAARIKPNGAYRQAMPDRSAPPAIPLITERSVRDYFSKGF